MLGDMITKAIETATGEKNIHLEAPEITSHGDYASNVAMQMYSKLPISNLQFPTEEIKSPAELANKIIKELKKNEDIKEITEKIEVAGPGFINFFLSDKALLGNIHEVNESSGIFLRTSDLKGKRIMLEFGQPNTHKLPHIGHLFSYIYGESLARILEANGAKIFRANYQGDVGLHVAKCLWAFKKEEPEIPDTLAKKVELLQKMYQLGSDAYEESDRNKDEIQALNKAIYDKDKEVIDLWQETRSWSVEYYKRFEERLGINYDKSYFESQVYEDALKIVKENDDVFKESKGAVIFEGSKFKLHDRVFITQNGNPTYEAKDLALETKKMKDWPLDFLIITTAHEQNAYFKVVFKALTEINPEFEGKLKHIGFGMVQLKGTSSPDGVNTVGKMSSRTGEFVGGVELVDETVKAVAKLVKKESGFSKKEEAKVNEKVGVGAVKYSFLKSNPLQDIYFDLNESVSKEGNSGPYLQYTFVRIKSVSTKAKNKKFLSANTRYKLTESEKKVLRLLVHAREELSESAANYSPNLFTNYLYKLAQEYNALYNRHKFIGSEKETLRLSINSAVGEILGEGLKLLGIETPERM